MEMSKMPVNSISSSSASVGLTSDASEQVYFHVGVELVCAASIFLMLARTVERFCAIGDLGCLASRVGVDSFHQTSQKTKARGRAWVCNGKVVLLKHRFNFDCNAQYLLGGFFHGY